MASSRMPRNPIVAQKSGTEFLQSSHFTLSQEENWTPGTRLSVFKKDYVPYSVDDKPPGAIPPVPAGVFGGDERVFNNTRNVSETLSEFQPKELSNRGTYDSNKLRMTNFKMDRDLDKVNSFKTTQQSSYPPTSGGFQKCKPSMVTSTSHLPQGDPDKERLPESDYKDRFKAHQLTKTEQFHPGGKTKTIQGDKRTSHFDTTHNDTFTGRWQIPTQSIPAGTGGNVPFGDHDKMKTGASEFQHAFPKPDAELKPYDRGTHGGLQKTQFRLDDNHNFFTNYSTTMKESYIPKESDVIRMSGSEKRNHSDAPEGDTDPFRQFDRSTTTTYNYHMQGPPSDFLNPHVNASDKRTASQVMLGDPDQKNKYYATTHKDQFGAYKDVTAPKRDGGHGKSVIPLDYYGDHVGNTTQKTDYIHLNTKKPVLGEEALDRIKRGNVKAPLGGQRFFSTTHTDTYTPKDVSGKLTVDTGRLQKSSVPLGTM